MRYKGRLIDFRVSIMPTIHGENAVLRVLDKGIDGRKVPQLTLDVVGFGAEDLRRPALYPRTLRNGVGYRPHRIRQDHYPLPPLNEIKSDEDKIITIEDPVEYQIRGITQIPVNEKKGLTFPARLRSILRRSGQILVGEIRDQETLRSPSTPPRSHFWSSPPFTPTT